ncbi:M57 family metalloprotease [Flavobacterium sp. 9]|uniref:M57 family metalloprotease n=1 Tax=Flavobacterium sp. 9 TaxID=2035198 RepID=UPI001304297B|nr:M57 family metalloprotease [Flavobacterium sp. 9]
MAASVQVYTSSEVTSEWRIAINKAINIWNDTNSGINITTVNTSTSLSVNVVMGEIGDRSHIANGYYPYGGKPGTRIMINTNFINKLKDADRLHTMIHELGHTFGLRHTNEPAGYLIPCTSPKDIWSIMFGMHDDTTTFTYFDNVAISTLYPVALGTKKLYRYKKNQYYFYATDACEITPSKDSYILDGDAGYLHSTQIPGTVPLYRILNGSTVKDHKLNKNQTSSNDVILGYLYPTQQPGTTPLYSYGIYESKPGQTPSYMYHYNYTTTNSEAILKVIIGYVNNKTITKETPKYPIVF